MTNNQAVKNVLQAFLKYKLPSRSEVQSAVKEQYDIDLTWDEVADIWYKLRDELNQKEDLPLEQGSCDLSSLTFLNTLKNQLRDVTRSLDATPHRFGQSLEATAVKHAVSTLLSELKVHGLAPQATEITLHELIERLAEKEHASWSHWMRYLFAQCVPQSDGSLVIPPDKVERWKGQMATEYAALTEQEKQSDRHRVQLILPLIEAYKS